MTRTFIIESASAASVPGRMGTHSSAWEAGVERTGSITTRRIPRSRALDNSCAMPMALFWATKP